MGLGVSIVVGIVIVPIMLQQFGKDGYGLVAICSALLALRTMIDFGLRAAVTRELAATGATGDQKRYNDLVSSSMAIYLLLGAVIALACGVFGPKIVNSLKVPYALHQEGTFLIRFYTGATFFLLFATAPMASILTSSDRFDILNYIDAGTQIMRALGVIIVLTMTQWGLYGWAAVEVLSSTINLLLVTVTAYRLRPSLRINFRRARFRTLPVRTSAHTFLLSVCDQISISSDNFVLIYFFGPSAVGLYEPARLLSRRLRPIIDSIKDQLHPLATRRFTEGRIGQLQTILFEGTKYRLLMGIGACIGLAIYAPHLAKVWLGNSLGPADLHTVSSVIILWAATDLVTYAGGSQWPVLFGMKEFGFLVRLGLPLSVLNLTASVLLVGFTDLGVIGVVIPTLCMEICRVAVTYWYCSRCLAMNIRHYFNEAYIRPLIVLIILVAVAEATRRIFNPDTTLLLIVCATICAFAWVLLSWFIGLRLADRKQILTLLYEAGRRRPGANSLYA
jgi:O-antigen/teichoic acid export membrane protein